jgi:hypothetical protein
MLTIVPLSRQEHSNDRAGHPPESPRRDLCRSRPVPCATRTGVPITEPDGGSSRIGPATPSIEDGKQGSERRRWNLT